MKYSWVLLFFLLFMGASHSQNNGYFTAEVIIGKTLPSNSGFPDTSLQKALFLSLGTYNNNKDSEWMARLGFPKTGLALGFTDLGNSEDLGYTISMLPYAEFNLFRKHTNRVHLNVGFGAAYVTKQFDFETNRFNRATTTKLNWAYRSFIYYDVFKNKKIDWRLGAGYSHFSNGHTGLPNQGSNSFLLSLSTLFHNGENQESFTPKSFTKKQALYISTRFGFGYNVLTRVINTKKEVYSIAVSLDKYVNPAFKFGGGFYLRYYQHYYDYIVNEGELINEDYSHFKESPFAYSLNAGVFATAELLLGHFGFEVDVGLNIYKPFYKIEWQISQNNDFSGQDQPLEPLDDYYELKRTISSRLGLKYYIFDTSIYPDWNIFFAAHINANLGQADFTELSIGYIYRFKH